MEKFTIKLNLLDLTKRKEGKKETGSSLSLIWLWRYCPEPKEGCNPSLPGPGKVIAYGPSAVRQLSDQHWKRRQVWEMVLFAQAPVCWLFLKWCGIGLGGGIINRIWCFYRLLPTPLSSLCSGWCTFLKQPLDQLGISGVRCLYSHIIAYTLTIWAWLEEETRLSRWVFVSERGKYDRNKGLYIEEC